MDPNTNCASSSNMTGEPNQANRSSVFGFDPYPPPYINWSQQDVFANPVTQFQPGPSIQQPQICAQNPAVPFSAQAPSEHQICVPNTAPQFTTTALPEQQVNFSFGSPRPVQDVVQFPFQINHGFGQRPVQSIRCKRKTDSPPLQPVKQHITEEIMAEHMSKLHINSETVRSSKESESDRTRRLYMCEEMRKLQTDSILPQSLMALSRMQSPCTALVLWKPPARIVPLAGEIDENENNNSQQQPDNNSANESEMENDVNNMDMDNC